MGCWDSSTGGAPTALSLELAHLVSPMEAEAVAARLHELVQRVVGELGSLTRERDAAKYGTVCRVPWGYHHPAGLGLYYRARFEATLVSFNARGEPVFGLELTHGLVLLPDEEAQRVLKGTSSGEDDIWVQRLLQELTRPDRDADGLLLSPRDYTRMHERLNGLLQRAGCKTLGYDVFSKELCPPADPLRIPPGVVDWGMHGLLSYATGQYKASSSCA